MRKTDQTFLGLPVYENPRIPADAPIYFVKGETLRDRGLEQAGSGAPVSVLIGWQDRARIALLWLCEADASFSAEDLRRAVGEPPTPACMGAVFRSAVKDGLIVADGFVQAQRPSRHASIERLWRGVRP